LATLDFFGFSPAFHYSGLNEKPYLFLPKKSLALIGCTIDSRCVDQLFPKSRLFNEGIQKCGSTDTISVDFERRKPTLRIVKIMDRKTDLLKMVRTLHPSRRFTSRLDCRQKKRNQNSDDRNDNKKFNESKGMYFAPPPYL